MIFNFLLVLAVMYYIDKLDDSRRELEARKLRERMGKK